VVGVAQPPRDLVVDLVGIPDFEVMHPDLRRRMHHRLKALGFVRRVTGSTARRERRCRHSDRAGTRTRTHAALERQSGSSTPGPRPAESVDHIDHPSIDRNAVRMSVEEHLRRPRSTAHGSHCTTTSARNASPRSSLARRSSSGRGAPIDAPSSEGIVSMHPRFSGGGFSRGSEPPHTST
jgi:hypothetical protein